MGVIGGARCQYHACADLVFSMYGDDQLERGRRGSVVKADPQPERSDYQVRCNHLPAIDCIAERPSELRGWANPPGKTWPAGLTRYRCSERR